MEMLYLSIKKRQATIQSLASEYTDDSCARKYLLIITASSKQRSKLRRVVSLDKIKLEDCVVKYNEISGEYANDEFPITCVGRIIDGDFPWSSLTG